MKNSDISIHLIYLTIPASVVEISDVAFDHCPALFTVHPENPVYASVEGRIRRKKR